MVKLSYIIKKTVFHALNILIRGAHNPNFQGVIMHANKTRMWPASFKLPLRVNGMHKMTVI